MDNRRERAYFLRRPTHMFEEAEPDDRPTCPRCGKPFLAVCEDYIPIVLYFCDKHGWHFMAEAVLPQKWSAADSIH